MDNTNARRISRSSSHGFTLIELLVVSAIMVIISSIILVNNNRFGGAILLENLAYDVALSVRQAQVYGISVRGSGTGAFDVGYGVHFVKAAPVYVLFADIVKDGRYTEGNDRIVLETTMQRGYTVKDLCFTDGGTETCEQAALTIVFYRPESAAEIRTDFGGPHDSARIVLQSPRGDTKDVVVGASGQISVPPVQ